MSKDELYVQIHLLTEELDTTKQVLAACAYWAACGLHPTYSTGFSSTMLENILKECKEYAVLEPGRDNTIVFEGFAYSYVPVGGWPEPEKEPM